ncbi:DNA-binding repressor [Trabulsiella guamensis ATCC 49490]|uniref:DNA-binding repressor n=1 Tax=Trabulsiella guamensis ATCC 49490 TaxID=1005994 RepID=A0A084ZKV2_9ENTR|nr:helix-turn-helix transcriptional regulator [Trabulsiella guamensis]KFB98096.1 DNA-binding repressor [Trabulsiella guamensis ATCC 49490]
MMTKSQDWHPEDIKAAIRKRGMTTSQLSRINGLADSTLRNVFRHHWPKGELIIAEYLELKPIDIWPSRYKKTVQKAGM